MASVRKRKWIYVSMDTDGNRVEKPGESWEVAYKAYDPKKKKERIFVKGGFVRKKDAQDWWVKQVGKVRSGTHTPDSVSITVAQAGKLWIEVCTENGLERSTTHQYQNHLDYHVKPYLGEMKLSQLTRPMVQDFVRNLRHDGRSQALARKVLTSLGSLIGCAEDHGKVGQNVARGLRVASLKRQKEKVVIPMPPEIQAFINKASGRWRPYIITAVFTGLRVSEMRALRWEDVDFEAKVIRVRRRADRWNEVGYTKSAAGRRDVPMGPMVYHTLKVWQKECPRKGKTEDNPGVLDLVFPNGAGNIENHSNIYRRGFVPLQIACGTYTELPPKKEGEEPRKQVNYGLHDLRHAAASMFIQYAGYEPKKVQTIMGHASIKMTFDVYGHLFPTPDDDYEAMGDVEARLAAASRKNAAIGEKGVMNQEAQQES